MTSSSSIASLSEPGNAPRLESPLAAPACAPKTPGTVLYIEDNLSNLLLVTGIFRLRPSFVLMSAREGRCGFDMALAQLPALILLDMQLPDVSGDQVLELLKNEPQTREIPVVILSADDNPQQINRLLEAGAQDYLTKPLNVKQLLGVLDQNLKEQP